jgi:sugar lactone lactonase YvrE
MTSEIKTATHTTHIWLLLAALLLTACQTPDAAGGPTASEQATTAETPLATTRTTGDLKPVATFPEYAPSGVAATDGRVFVTFPRWDPGIPYTVAEIVDGQPVPYPNQTTNEVDRDNPAEHLLSVESVTVGPDGGLWVLDSGRPDFDQTIAGGAKLVRVDLQTDRITRTIVLPDEVARPDSYLAGLRIDGRHGADGVAVAADSSPSGFNGLVVVDLASGEAWRQLDLHDSTRADREFIPIVEGERMLFQPKGWEPSQMSMGVNGLAIEATGERLYYRTMASRELYSVRLDALADPDRTPPEIAASLRRYGDLGFASDGLVAGPDGAIYMTNYEDGAIVRRGPTGDFRTVAYDRRLLWPDSLAISDGHLYVTVNQRHRSPVFNRGVNRKEPPFVLFRMPLDGT